MFERYTEKARRVIFFARYEASKYGSVEISTEHLLLALIHEDMSIFKAILSDVDKIKSIQEELRAQEGVKAQEPVGTGVDLPLSNPSKRVLAYAAEEAERLSDRHIGTEHQILGLLRESSPAAQVLNANGIDLARMREKLRRPDARGSSAERTPRQPSQRLVHDVLVEFVEEGSQAIIAMVEPPAIVPARGEEVVFGSRSFHVLKVSYIYPETTALDGLAHITPRIRVYLEAVTQQP
jgi:ATP-dependent Clp protease ATP-binding subunit ClpC